MEHTQHGARSIPREIEQAILRELNDIRFGSIEIVVHDSKVVQIERKEKIRFNADRSL